jgi:WD40 repeat protein
VRGLAFSDGGKTLWSAGYDGKVIAWDAAADNPAPKLTLDAHAGWVRALAVSPDGKLLATCGNDNLVKLWSLPDGKPVRTLEGHTATLTTSLPSRRQGVRLRRSARCRQALGDRDRQAGAFDAAVLTVRPDVRGAQRRIRAFSFHDDGGLLACRHHGGRMRSRASASRWPA